MSAATASFYVTGGTLRQDAPSYVERQADKDLYEGLTRGEFCYVLTSRQMGKSSLMVHTAARLREVGVTVVVLDFTSMGQQVTVEQWYDGLLGPVGRQLDLEDELEDFWLGHERLGPLQRWMRALREVVLAHCPGPVVLLLDEIDAVRSLPFSTDEFFAGIRECYNRRTQDSEFNRLTFCLLGVATPSDLIQDTRTTPFNVGRRIELTDFTAAEAGPLAGGLGREAAIGMTLLERVLYWTGGHPYLTQRLCRAVAGDESVQDAASVDRLCEGLLLSRLAQEQDDNLLFVRERLLRSEAEAASLLDLYSQVLRGRRVLPDDTDQRVSLLRLSGVTRVSDGRLRVRNRIYQRVFDREWIIAHMPDAELRRQRAAYWRGLWRAAAVSGVVLTAMGGLVLAAVNQARLARRATAREAQQRRLAERRLYIADMTAVQRAWEDGDVARGALLLAAHGPGSGQEDLRGFEWRMLWSLCRDQSRYTLPSHPWDGNCIAVSPDGKMLAMGSEWSLIRLWDVVSRRVVATLRGHTDGVWSVAFSPDGKSLASASSGDDKRIILWDVASHQQRAVLLGHRTGIGCVAFSPGGRLLASASSSEGPVDGSVKLWDILTRRELVSVSNHHNSDSSLAFSSDGKLLAFGCGDRTVRVCEVGGFTQLPPRIGRAGISRAEEHARTVSLRRIASLRGSTGPITDLAFAPDGKSLALASEEGSVKLWDLAARREIACLHGYRGSVTRVVFSPDGRTLATSCVDGTIKLWDIATRHELATLRGHQGSVNQVTFFPDGKTLASASEDYTVRLWDVTPRWDPDTLAGHKGTVNAVTFSPDGRTLASASVDGTVKLWNLTAQPGVRTLHGHSRGVYSVAFAPDGKTLASASDADEDRAIRLWDPATGRTLHLLRGHTGSVASAVFADSGRTLASTGWDGRLRLWDVATGRKIASLPAAKRGHHGLASSPNGQLLAGLGSNVKTIRLWDVAGRRVLVDLRGHAAGVYVLAFSPDSQLLASSSEDGMIKLWSIATRREMFFLQGPRGQIAGLAFSPDGKILASASPDGTLRLWNLAIRHEVATLRASATKFTSVAFSPDGNTLAAGGADGKIRLWSAAPFARADPEVSAVLKRMPR